MKVEEQQITFITKPQTFLTRLDYLSFLHKSNQSNSWLSFDKQNQEFVFCKISSTHRENLSKEFSLLQELGPRFVKPRDLLSSDDCNTSALLLEYLDGEDLMTLHGLKLLDQDILTKVESNVSQGLQELHQLGMIHNDIKPSNIFLTKRGEVKILDLGCSQKIGDPPGKTTKYYEKPGREVCEPEDDLFSLRKTMQYLTKKKCGVKCCC